MRILFSLTALLGAFLLFLVEPMFARMLLPLLGGAPAVWNTCLVFYQCALFAGYLYAHVVGRRSARQQVLLQVGLLILAGAALPIAVRGGGTPPPSANPVGWVLWILVASLGLPFVMLATTGPLLQRWYASLNETAARTAYSLFAASNVGSFLALLGYPLLVEPTLRLHAQSIIWATGYGVYGLLMAACGAVVWRTVTGGAATVVAPEEVAPKPARRQKRGPEADSPADVEIWAGRLRWLGLAAVPSTLMMSVTTFISTDVASMPLLWVVPLALYLLTFVIAFSSRQLVRPRQMEWLFANAVVIIVALVMAPAVYPLTLMALHLACFFVIALACHRELAASRPPAESLTEFYLWLSAGGAVGGLFNALVAPVIFINPFEYPLAAISACLLLPNALTAPVNRSNAGTVLGWLRTALPVVLVEVMLAVVQQFDASLPDGAFERFLIIFVLPCLAAFTLRRTPLRMGIALASIVVAGMFVRFDNRLPIHLERSFFGVHRVLFTGRERVLLSGTTNHGSQSIDPALKCEPLSYYSRGGPIGQAFQSIKESGTRKRFGVVGLGTATLAAYAASGEQWTFFEINPVVERIARDPEYFTYLRDCAPAATVITGDARLMLANQPAGAFDLLVLDAFSSDSIPVHLMTENAIRLYFDKIAPGGVLAVHVSNRYLDLAPVVGATAQSAGFVSIVQTHVPTEEQLAISAEISASRWVLVARSVADLGTMAQNGRWATLDATKGPVWTDDYSNVLGVIRR